jgi:HAD superfamily hydrolase (TIGR01509 family)
MKSSTLVIFDCDGVLVDSEPLANAVFAKHLRQLGIEITQEQTMARFMGRSMKSSLEDVRLELLHRKLSLPANFPQAFLDAMQLETFEELRNNLQAVDGIEFALDAITTLGADTCIASSGDHEKMAVTLGKTGLLPRFAGRIYSATQVSNGKPAPDLFMFAAAQMQVAPQNCAVIEDSPYGVEAAVAAGMTAFAYCALTPRQSILDRPGVQQAWKARQVHFFQTMRELPALLSVNFLAVPRVVGVR